MTRELLMILALLFCWCVLAGLASVYIGRHLRINVQSNHARTQAHMRSRRPLDISKLLP